MSEFDLDDYAEQTLRETAEMAEVPRQITGGERPSRACALVPSQRINVMSTDQHTGHAKGLLTALARLLYP
jgi:hypothetical protein